MKILRAVVVLTLAAWTHPAQGQVPPAADPAADRGGVEGTIVNAHSGEPLKRAHITLNVSGGTGGSEPILGMTDAAGKFKIGGITPGTYRVAVAREGFVRPRKRGEDSAREPAVLTIQPKQNIAGLQYRLAPASVLTGVVVDEDNAPMAGVRLQCLHYAYRRSGRALISGGTTTTDDRGQYRLAGLSPGRYYVRATYNDPASMIGPIRGGPAVGYPSQYFPGVMDAAQAGEVAVQESEERPGVDFKLAPGHVVHIQGQVMNFDGRLASRVIVSLGPRMSAGLSGQSPIIVGNDGAFRFDGVTAGSYMLTASMGTTRVAQILEVGESDQDNVRLFLNAHTDLKGRIRVEGDRKVSLTGLPLVLSPSDDSVLMLAGSGVASIDADGSFVFRSVAAGDYRVLIDGLPEDSYVKTVSLGNRPSDDGVVHFEGAAGGVIELLISSAGGRVDGSLTDDQQKAAANVSVVLVPDGALRSRNDLYRMATSDQNGHFGFRGIPPGDYKLFAWRDELEAWSWIDPAVLAPYETQGKSVSVAAGSRNAVDLQAIEVHP